MEKSNIKKQTIWKYNLLPIGEQFLELPSENTILSVQTQDNNICIWVKINPECTTKIQKTIEIIGTGHSFTDEYHRIFIGTVQIHSLVFHIFERV